MNSLICLFCLFVCLFFPLQDETDSAFRKFHFRKRSKKKNSNASTPSTPSSLVPNNAHPEANSRPDPILEEQQQKLVDSPAVASPENSLSSSSSSSVLEPGADPLSKLAAAKSSKSSLTKEEAHSNSLEWSYLNNEEGGYPGEGVVSVQYGKCLSEEDHRNLRNFVIDLVSKRLLPHLNEVLKSLNEWVSVEGGGGEGEGGRERGRRGRGGRGGGRGGGEGVGGSGRGDRRRRRKAIFSLLSLFSW